MKKKLRVTVSVTVPEDDEFSSEEQAFAVCDGLQRILCYNDVSLQSIEAFTDGPAFAGARNAAELEGERG
jgi:hypothetical protein